MALSWRPRGRPGGDSGPHRMLATAAAEATPAARPSDQPLARDNLTMYDAAYVALAERLDVVLLTADPRLT
jgi:hypothetical protein